MASVWGEDLIVGLGKGEEDVGDAESIRIQVQAAQAKRKAKKIKRIIAMLISIIKSMSPRIINKKNICNDLILSILKLRTKLRRHKDK